MASRAQVEPGVSARSQRGTEILVKHEGSEVKQLEHGVCSTCGH